MSDEDWTTANQRVLVAEFARLVARITGTETVKSELELATVRGEIAAPPAIDRIVDGFGLSTFERDLLLLSAGTAMDGVLAAACAQLTGGQPTATFALALEKLADPHWSAIAPGGPLRRHRLLAVREERAVASSALDVEERVIHFLAGIDYLDPQIAPLLQDPRVEIALVASHGRVVDDVLRDVLCDRGAGRCVHFAGDDREAAIEVARRVAEWLGLRLYLMRGTDIPASPCQRAELAVLWNREAVFARAALLVDTADCDFLTLESFLSQLTSQIFTTGTSTAIHERARLSYAVTRPGAGEQKRLWLDALGECAGELDGVVDEVATQFRLSTEIILRTANAIRRFPAPEAQLKTRLWDACRRSARRRLDDLAQRIPCVADWDDLVLPESQTATLRQIAVHVRQRLKVYEEWGFAAKISRGLGVSVLFSGESGTGKTLAAEVLAGALHLDLYRIDLASMVSKYIGETEKNLRRIFDAAEDSGAMLLFDEADALFGKRSEVKDSHDRYANIEVSYLLQRMEAYRGLAILTTNLKASLDPAFQRRLRFVVQFPFPDASLRERIWRCAFPPALPLDAVDPSRLARLNVTGGSIRNIALNAAFLAAQQNVALGMSHLLHAARIEAVKCERPFSETETRGWQ